MKSEHNSRPSEPCGNSESTAAQPGPWLLTEELLKKILCFFAFNHVIIFMPDSFCVNHSSALCILSTLNFLICFEYRDSTYYFKKLTVNSGYSLTNCQATQLKRISLQHHLSFKKKKCGVREKERCQKFRSKTLLLFWSGNDILALTQYEIIVAIFMLYYFVFVRSLIFNFINTT